MAELSIERLSLHLSGWCEGDGRRLARMIADGLAAAAASGTPQERDSLQCILTPRANTSMQELSDQIVADLLSQLQRTV
jgi:hypothetical protein